MRCSFWRLRFFPVEAARGVEACLAPAPRLTMRSSEQAPAGSLFVYPTLDLAGACR